MAFMAKIWGMMDPMALLTLVQSGLMMLDSGLDGASIVDTIYYDTKKGEISLGLASTCCANANKSSCQGAGRRTYAMTCHIQQAYWLTVKH